MEPTLNWELLEMIQQRFLLITSFINSKCYKLQMLVNFAYLYKYLCMYVWIGLSSVELIIETAYFG